MKLTKLRLKQIIKEELQKILMLQEETQTHWCAIGKTEGDHPEDTWAANFTIPLSAFKNRPGGRPDAKWALNIARREGAGARPGKTTIISVKEGKCPPKPKPERKKRTPLTLPIKTGATTDE